MAKKNHVVWERQTGEHFTSYQMFCYFRDLPPQDRNYKRVAEFWKRSPDTIRDIAKKWDWVLRTEKFDEKIDEIRTEKQNAALKTEAEKWAQRQLTIRDDEWNLFLKLKERIHAMLDFPLATVQKKDGDKNITINPSKWFMGDVAKLAAVMSQVGRLSAEMETTRHKVESEVTRELERILGLLEKHLPKDQFERIVSTLAGTEDNEGSEILPESQHPRIRPIREFKGNVQA